MKKTGNKIVALTFVVCLVMSAVFGKIPEQMVEASENVPVATNAETEQITTENIPEGYKWVTASDFHTVDSVSMARTISPSSGYDGTNYNHDVNSYFDKTVFTANVTFASEGDSRIYFGGEWQGISLRSDGDNLNLYQGADTYVKTLTPNDTCGQLTGKEIVLTVSFEIVEKDETNAQVRLGIFVDDKLYDNTYITLSNVGVGELTQRIGVDVWAGSSLVIRDDKTPVPTYLFEYTTSTIGLNYWNSNVRTDKIGRDNVDGTMFGVKLKYTRTDELEWFQYGGTGDWHGLRITLTEDGKVKVAGSAGELALANESYILIEPTKALGETYTTFNGQEFTLHISTEVVNHDSNSELDVRYGFYINGKLYNDTFFYSYNTASMLGKWVGFQQYTPEFGNAGSISEKTVRTDLEQLSIDDIAATYGTGWNSSAYTHNLNPSYARFGVYEAAGNFVGKTFGVDMTLAYGSNQTFFQIGGSGEWDGLRFKVDNNNLIIESGGVTTTTVTPDFIGEDSFNGTPITIWVSTELIAVDDATTKDDVSYTIYINDKIYTTLYALNQASELSNGVAFANWEDGSTFSVAEKTTAPITVSKDMETISFCDFDIANGAYEDVAGKIGTYEGELAAISQTVFNGYVNFSSTRSSVGETRKQATLCFLGAEGGADSLYGMRLSNEYEYINVPDNALSLSFWNDGRPIWLYSELAGVDLLDNEFKLAIQLCAADFDGDDNATDALVGVYINDVLYNNTWFKATNALGSSNYGPCTRIYTVGSSLIVASVIDETFPSDLLTLTADEFGIAGQWDCDGDSGVVYNELSSNYTPNNLSKDAMSLVGKTIDLDLAYSGVNYLHFATANIQSWHGVRIQTGDGFVKVESSLENTGSCPSVTCTPNMAGVDFTKEFNLKLTFVPINDTNNVYVGVWFNNKLYNHQYLLWEDVADKLNASVNIIPFGGGAITIKDPIRNVPTEAEGYTCKTLSDYGFTTDYKYEGNSSEKCIEGLNTEKLVISGKLALTGKGHMVLVGDWLGYYLGIDWDKNEVYLNHTNSLFDKKITARLLDVANGQFAFDLVQTFVDADFDGNKDDVQLELWIDGKLAEGKSHYYIDYQSEATSNYCRVFPDGGTVTIVNNLYYEYTDGYYFNLAHGDYLATATTVNKENQDNIYEAGDKITVGGDYQITRDDESSKVINEVYLWKSGDVHTDNEIDVIDVVAAKKVKAGRITSKSKMKAADLDNDGKADDNVLRNYLVGLVDDLNSKAVESVYFTLDEDGTPVMPISGFWGPRMLETDAYTDEMELNMIQEKYYEAIAKMGINIINYIEVDAAQDEFSLTQNLQNLALAEKYNIGLFVMDSAVNGDMTEDELARRLSLYGKYGSFLGIHTYDEPCSDNYYASAENKKISDIADEAKKLNSYTNLSSYINLYPLTESGADNYVKEYLASCAPKYLSFDYYPNFTEENSWTGSIRNTGYFTGLSVARDAGIPFWAYVTAGDRTNFTMNATTTDNLAPTRSQFLWNVNTTLAFGAKGIQYFPMIQPGYFSAVSQDESGNVTKQDFERNGLIGANGEQTKWAGYATDANKWIGMIDGILMNATSVDILTTGTTVTTDISSSSISSHAKYSGQNGATVSAVSGGNAIVGVFNYQGKTAYYVVNYDWNSTNDNVTTKTITLTFDADKTMTVYNSNNMSAGAVQTSTTNKALALDVECGGAALVIVD